MIEAYKNASKNKHYRADVLRFSNKLEAEILALIEELADSTYEVGDYRQFYVREPKVRLIMSLSFRDRVVQWVLYTELNDFYDKMMIDDSYACRKGRGREQAANRLQSWMRKADRSEYNWYYLKLDISKYFYRIDHKILIEILSRRIKDEKILDLLWKIIENKNTRFGLPPGKSPSECSREDMLLDVGMPIGNLLSQFFANIYLNELDQYCKHELHIHYYIRYMDDVVILCKSKEQLLEYHWLIQEFLDEKLHLTLNSKTALRPVSNGISFVGYHLWSTHRKLRKTTVKRMTHSVMYLAEEYKQGHVSLEFIESVFSSYKGLMDHCQCYHLKRKFQDVCDAYNIHKIDRNKPPT